eukprot:SAG25_NODE_961_length_4546_cov_6.941758_2_plen_232_part_00
MATTVYINRYELTLQNPISKSVGDNISITPRPHSHTYRKLAVLRPYGLPDTEWQRCNATLFSAACNLHALQVPPHSTPTSEPPPTQPKASILKQSVRVASIATTPSLLTGDKHPNPKNRWMSPTFPDPLPTTKALQPSLGDDKKYTFFAHTEDITQSKMLSRVTRGLPTISWRVCQSLTQLTLTRGEYTPVLYCIVRRPSSSEGSEGGTDGDGHGDRSPSSLIGIIIRRAN